MCLYVPHTLTKSAACTCMCTSVHVCTIIYLHLFPCMNMNVHTHTYTCISDKVHFGEVAHEPPRLKAKPRGSAKGTRKSKSDSLLLLGKLEPSAGKSKTDSPDIKPGGLKRQRDIEMEREKAIEHYRSIKKARTKKQ